MSTNVYTVKSGSDKGKIYTTAELLEIAVVEGTPEIPDANKQLRMQVHKLTCLVARLIEHQDIDPRDAASVKRLTDIVDCKDRVSVLEFTQQFE